MRKLILTLVLGVAALGVFTTASTAEARPIRPLVARRYDNHWRAYGWRGYRYQYYRHYR
jgi:hypothetical protein